MSDKSEGSGSENYEVEGIIGHKDSTRSGRKYEIKWKGYKETTFEPRENLVPNATKLVNDYDKKHPKGKKSLRKEKSKPKKESKSRKSKRNKILDSESEGESDDEATDSNIENWKPNVKANQKKTLSKRVKSKMGGSNSSKTRLSNSKKRVKVTKSSQVKKRGRSRITAVKSSSDEEYDVDILLDHRDEAARRMYLVKWEGYPTSEATWEPSSNLSCKQLVRQYEHLKGKWKRPRKRPRGGDEKTPTKRVRTSSQGNESDHEEKEKIVKKQGEGDEKVKTSSKEKEGDKATAGAVTETSAGEKDEKREEAPKSDTPKKDPKQDSTKDKSTGDEKIEKKEDADAEAETKEVPDEKKEVEEDGKSEDKAVENKKSEGEDESAKIVD